MPKHHVTPDAFWKMRIDHPYSMLCIGSELAASCGQAPIGESGDDGLSFLDLAELFDYGSEVLKFLPTACNILTHLINDEHEGHVPVHFRARAGDF